MQGVRGGVRPPVRELDPQAAAQRSHKLQLRPSTAKLKKKNKTGNQVSEITPLTQSPLRDGAELEHPLLACQLPQPHTMEG